MTIFEHSDYKLYLKTYIAALPRKGRGEINRLANYLSVHPTLVSQVISGSKDFTAEQAYRLCGYLGLAPLESDYFILLVQVERAGTHDFKKYYKAKLEDLKKTSLQLSSRLAKHRSLTEQERAIFYSSWIYSAVRLFTSVGIGQTMENVALRFSLSRSAASEILIFLKDAQLCIEENGIYKMKEQHTHLEFGSPFLSRHHTNWRLKSVQRSEKLTGEELMFTSPLSISAKDFAKIREELMNTIKLTSKVIKDSPAENIACFNIDLFWIGD